MRSRDTRPRSPWWRSTARTLTSWIWWWATQRASPDLATPCCSLRLLRRWTCSGTMRTVATPSPMQRALSLTGPPGDPDPARWVDHRGPVAPRCPRPARAARRDGRSHRRRARQAARVLSHDPRLHVAAAGARDRDGVLGQLRHGVRPHRLLIGDRRSSADVGRIRTARDVRRFAASRPDLAMAGRAGAARLDRPLGAG